MTMHTAPRATLTREGNKELLELIAAQERDDVDQVTDSEWFDISSGCYIGSRNWLWGIENAEPVRPGRSTYNDGRK